MTTSEDKPDWLKNYHSQPDPARPPGARGFSPGVSGNPAGRPKGRKDKKTRIAEEFERDGSKVARVVIDKAMTGDMTAANLVLQRISPPLKTRAEKVKFELNSKAPLTDQARQVLAAMATGEIDPDTAQVVINCISAFAGLRQVDELDERLRALEGKAA
jgi:hypothetical protein